MLNVFQKKTGDGSIMSKGYFDLEETVDGEK